MDLKQIKGNLDIASMIITQWQRTGKLSEIERIFLLNKLEELYESIKYSDTKILPMGAGAIAERTFTEFSVEIDPLSDEAQDTLESTPPQSYPYTSTQPGDQIPESAEDARSRDDLRVDSGRSYRGKLDKKAIRSLYEDGPVPCVDTPSPHPVAAPAPEAQPESVLSSSSDEESHTESLAAETHTSYVTDETIAALEEEPTPVAEEPQLEAIPENEVAPAANIPETQHTAQEEIPQPQDNPLADLHRGKTIGDVVNREDRTIGQSNDPENKPRIPTEKIASIRHAIGVNDKYLMIHELFGGDVATYDLAIASLDSFSELDDAMLWIHDNYQWNAESQGARLLIDILFRKLT